MNYQEFSYVSILRRKSAQVPWNKGKLVGQKPPLKLPEIWAIRIRLEIDARHRDLAMFNLAIDSKLRACDLLELWVSDVSNSGRVASRAMIIQLKTQRPVQFEITSQTRESISAWIRYANLGASEFLFPSRSHRSNHVSREADIKLNLPKRSANDRACVKTQSLEQRW